MRVLHVQRVSGVGGSERHLASLLPALGARGVEARMCVLATGDPSRFIGDLGAAGIEVSAIPAGPDLNPAALVRLVREVRAFAPDLVHTHLLHGDTHGQLAARLASVAAVSSFHASPPFYEREPYRSVARLVARLPRLTIAISAHLGDYLVERGLAPAERVRVVPYGIDSRGWRLPADARERARTELGLAPATVAVGVASRLVPEKGHADLISAMAIAARRQPDLRLLVAGVGPLRHALERQAAAALAPGACRFLGFVDDIRAFMNACDIFAFPTTPHFGEGFGLAALEASAAGRPIVATAVGPIPEVVADGESGRVVPPGSPAALAEALAELAADGELRHRLGEGAALRAGEVFSLDRMVESTVAVYREALCRPQHGRGYTPSDPAHEGRGG